MMKRNIPRPAIAVLQDQVMGGHMSERLASNIAALAERRRREKRSAPLGARIAHRITCFTGSMTFVVLHLIFYGAWIVANLGLIPGVTPWDETFVMLAMEASVEAIFLSTFVLINQNRQGAEADRRAELDLHVGLLTEDELTKLARLLEAIAEKLDVPVHTETMDEVKKNIDPNSVLDALDAVGAHEDDADDGDEGDGDEQDGPAMKASTAS